MSFVAGQGSRCFVPVRAPGQGSRSRVCRLRATAKAAAQGKLKESVAREFERLFVPIYMRPSPVFVSGRGARVADADGDSYLDFSGGIAVNALGHGDPRLLEALSQQSQKLIHMSNLFHTLPAIELAQRLIDHSFADKAYFCNSGTEATEAAIKFSRKWAAVMHGVDPSDADSVGPSEIVSFTKAFHGRTMGALAITPKEKYQSPFLPMMPGHRLASFNDLTSAASVIESGKTCAVFVEPVQVNPHFESL